MTVLSFVVVTLAVLVVLLFAAPKRMQEALWLVLLSYSLGLTSLWNLHGMYQNFDHEIRPVLPYEAKTSARN